VCLSSLISADDHPFPQKIQLEIRHVKWMAKGQGGRPTAPLLLQKDESF
jgi:hypothetical protein